MDTVSLMARIPSTEIPRGSCLRHRLIYPFIFVGSYQDDSGSGSFLSLGDSNMTWLRVV